MDIYRDFYLLMILQDEPSRIMQSATTGYILKKEDGNEMTLPNAWPVPPDLVAYIL